MSQVEKKKIMRRSVAPYYGTAAVCLGYALLFPLYRISDILLMAAAGTASFLVLRAVCKDVEEEIQIPIKEEPPASTGNVELDRMIRDGGLAIQEMRRLNDNIEDEGISRKIDRLEALTEKIFAQVKAEPKKLPQIRRFMDYFLPTTLKLLNAYDRMGAAGIAGENITTSMSKMENMMDAIVSAFEKQLDGLFGAEAMDISTDISVMETMLAREGLAGEQMKAETAKDAYGQDIDLKL